ncbi:OmpA family protein [Pseudomonas sp. MAFF 302046]|uniref:OmpA family protein n=1 Tax=Pseudomonas morbosilactucae TaxID=2938197 RepID=A0ABT0JGX9_9PSED|nr:OmpA family protein [Pseudomonas morbosilactucae]MCK9815162.1 OmpA family protein [Pseudomonas morbosilactucae]
MNRQRVAVRMCAWGALWLMVGALSACASVPAPDDQVGLSRSAVSRAVAAEATQYAPLEMQTAQDKMFLMERALGEGDHLQARVLAEQIEVDANLAERKVRVEGFTDSVGSGAFNQRLSQQRARSVASALVQLGVAPARVISQGYAMQYPIADNGSAPGRQLNRRVEVIVSNGAALVGTRH